MHSVTAVLLLAVLGAVPTSQSGAPGAPPAGFEVASVKPNAGARGVSLRLQPGGRFTATNVTLRELIRFAYQVQAFQIEGDAEILNVRFDVIAKAADDLPGIQPGVVGPVNTMVQALLADRFQLRTHREEREMSIYALIRARSDGALGPEIESRTELCEPSAKAPSGAGPDQRRPGWPAARGEVIPCGVTMLGTGRVATGGMAMSQFVRTLAGVIGEPVLDRTEMPGVFAFQLDYAPTVAVPLVGDQPPAFVDRPSIFTALQEQLGLKLERIRAPVDVLVIDSVRPPDPD